jgi:hypothetical protein
MTIQIKRQILQNDIQILINIINISNNPCRFGYDIDHHMLNLFIINVPIDQTHNHFQQLITVFTIALCISQCTAQYKQN